MLTPNELPGALLAAGSLLWCSLTPHTIMCRKPQCKNSTGVASPRGWDPPVSLQLTADCLYWGGGEGRGGRMLLGSADGRYLPVEGGGGGADGRDEGEEGRRRGNILTRSLSSSILILPEEAPWPSLVPLSSANTLFLTLKKKKWTKMHGVRVYFDLRILVLYLLKSHSGGCTVSSRIPSKPP